MVTFLSTTRLFSVTIRSAIIASSFSMVTPGSCRRSIIVTIFKDINHIWKNIFQIRIKLFNQLFLFFCQLITDSCKLFLSFWVIDCRLLSQRSKPVIHPVSVRLRAHRMPFKNDSAVKERECRSLLGGNGCVPGPGRGFPTPPAAFSDREKRAVRAACFILYTFHAHASSGSGRLFGPRKTCGPGGLFSRPFPPPTPRLCRGRLRWLRLSGGSANRLKNRPFGGKRARPPSGKSTLRPPIRALFPLPLPPAPLAPSDSAPLRHFPQKYLKQAFKILDEPGGLTLCQF